MGRTSVKSTYALDLETVRKLDRLAEQWQVSKSEVLRRAVSAAASTGVPAPLTAHQALNKLWESIELSDSQIEKWARATRRERVAGSLKREWHSK